MSKKEKVSQVLLDSKNLERYLSLMRALLWLSACSQVSKQSFNGVEAIPVPL